MALFPIHISKSKGLLIQRAFDRFPVYVSFEKMICLYYCELFIYKGLVCLGVLAITLYSISAFGEFTELDLRIDFFMLNDFLLLFLLAYLTFPFESTTCTVTLLIFLFDVILPLITKVYPDFILSRSIVRLNFKDSILAFATTLNVTSHKCCGLLFILGCTLISVGTRCPVYRT